MKDENTPKNWKFWQLTHSSSSHGSDTILLPSYPDTLGKLQDLEVSYENCELEVEIS